VDFIWVRSVLVYKVAKVFILVSLMTIVMGALVKNPTGVMSDEALDHEVSGLLKITRQPFQWEFCCSPAPTCWLMVMLLQSSFLDRLLFCLFLGCYRWTKGVGGKLTQNGRFPWIKPPWFHSCRCYAADCGSRSLILTG
jgi:hypothetical protein